MAKGQFFSRFPISSREQQQVFSANLRGAQALRTLRYRRSMDCIFCKIASGAVAADLLYQDEEAVAFRDLHPQAPVHFLVIPRLHLLSLAGTAREHAALLGHLLAVAVELAADQGLGQGFRTVINAGEHGGQTVDHLHVHILGGRQLGWPPG